MAGNRRITAAMRVVELEHRMDIETLLWYWYVHVGETQEQLSHRLGVDKSTVSKWLKRFGIQVGMPPPRVADGL